MIKSALQYLVGLKDVKVIPVNGQNYSTEQLKLIEEVLEDAPATLQITTLTGLVNYIKENIDNINETLVVHVVSPKEVKVFSELKKGAVRHTYIAAKALTPEIVFEQFMETEKFNIMLQSCFIPNHYSRQILKVVGNIVEDNVRTTGDNGVSQVVTAKAGISTVADVAVPNPVTLIPFRTFAEVDQVDIEFVFRLKEGPKAALFEADGGKWKLTAIQTVTNYLKQELEGCNVKIIS